MTRVRSLLVSATALLIALGASACGSEDDPPLPADPALVAAPAAAAETPGAAAAPPAAEAAARAAQAATPAAADQAPGAADPTAAPVAPTVPVPAGPALGQWPGENPPPGPCPTCPAAPPVSRAAPWPAPAPR